MAPLRWYHNSNSEASSKPIVTNITNLQLRFLCPADIRDVWTLCSECFPIEYPHSWYEEITSNPKFYSLAALHEGKIVGIIVAEIKEYIRLSQEDRDIISPCLGSATEVGYILSLAVNRNYRRNGVASLLLDNLIAIFTTKEYSCCKAIFLHVLTTNTAAIRFYERKNFRLHTFLPYYYFIRGKCKDGFTYVLYINGGHPPRNGFFENIKYTLRLAYESEAALWAWEKCFWIFQWMLPGTRRIVVDNSTAIVMQYS
ncbi:N-alpha-acetyltransferase 60 [Planococcus citri]|uniref:N-alpha-acetyltransferase 60 n=1 Tax=Planococcus citri TaxID=170843 RepID=UPI0031F763E5